MAGALGLEDPIEGVPLAEHVPFTQQWIDTHRNAPPHDTKAAFIGSFTSLADAASRLTNADLATATQYYGFAIPRGTALVAASFELWAHVDDIRRAVGHQPHPLSAEELSIMCRLAAGVLPFTLGYVGTPHPDRTARLVLTGTGGGTFVVSTGGELPPTGGEDALIVTDALDFCRIAGRHLDVDEVALEVEGDEAFARDLLAECSRSARRPDPRVGCAHAHRDLHGGHRQRDRRRIRRRGSPRQRARVRELLGLADLQL